MKRVLSVLFAAALILCGCADAEPKSGDVTDVGQVTDLPSGSGPGDPLDPAAYAEAADTLRADGRRASEDSYPGCERQTAGQGGHDFQGQYH